MYESRESPINVGRVIGALNIVLSCDAVLVADGGFASHWAGLLYDTKRSGRGVITNRGFASIGYGLPGSLGAQLAAPDRQVVGITGDGGLNMSVGGLETAVRTGAPFTLLVINNAASGYVKALQHAVYGAGAYQSSDLHEMDYARVAEAFGCRGVRVEDPTELEAVLSEAITDTSRPSVVDIVVTRDPGAMLPGTDNRTVSGRPPIEAMERS
jgi:acetolactate synthase-1/2/3 large subunit